MRQVMAWAPLACLLLVSVTTVASRRCCPDDEILLMAEKHCSVTTKHRPLNCTKGMYLVDPGSGRDNDLFLVTEDDYLQMEDEDLVDPDSYCITHLHRKDGTLTSEEVAFVCFPDDEMVGASSVTSSRHKMIGVFVVISIVFLLATLVVYGVLPEMRDLEGKCLTSAVLSLLVGYVLLAMLQFHGAHYGKIACISSAFLLYFWMISSFFWLNVVSGNLWRSVVYPITAWSERRLFACFCVYGWGCPAVFVAVALVTHHLPGDHVVRPGFGDASCWFNGSVETWSYFYGPIAAIIACNTVFFVWTALTLWRSCNESAPRLHSMKYKCALYTKLFVIMGISWIFELISHLVDPNSKSYVWYLTDILNSLQGLLIFIITVACRKRVLRALSRRRACGFNWPKRWAAGVDAETDGILTDEIAEMSQPALESATSSPEHH